MPGLSSFSSIRPWGTYSSIVTSFSSSTVASQGQCMRRVAVTRPFRWGNEDHMGQVVERLGRNKLVSEP